ncbi:probable G-protein coupled receptor 139 [Lineus longissimus]|uniref:probable G-protein coupled receptor 139 n=1 Tax=Lineus longissimus TaxID=88925 RepID=UPI00315C87DF
MTAMAESTSLLHSVLEKDDLSYFYYIWLVPLVFGLPGNVLAIIIANRRNNRHLSPCIYMTAMGVADLVLVLERIGLIIFTKALLEHNVAIDLSWYFKVTVYVLHTSSILSGLFLSGLSIDRLIAVRFPMHAQRLCTTSRAKTSIILITVILSLANIHLLYMVTYFKDKLLGIYVWVLSTPGYPVFEEVVTGFHMIFGTILPFFIIFSCNVVIIITLRQASNERRKMDSNQQKNKDSQHLTRMLLFVSFAYVIITLPYRLTHMLIKIPAISNTFDMTTLLGRTEYVVLLWGMGNIWMCNYCINFYLYCLGGGRRYRTDAKQLFREFFRC